MKSRETSLSSITGSSQRVELKTEDMGFTLRIDSETLGAIDALHEEAAKAAQAIKRFAWR